MKNKIQSLVCGVVVAFLFLFVGVAHAQKGSEVNKPKPPKVPIEIISQGYQAVTSYLLKQTKYIRYRCVGDSVFNSPETDRWIYLPQHVSESEYVPGSFESLSDALASQRFDVQLIANSLGMYDVHLEISYVTSDNEVAFTGYGHMSVFQNMDGNLKISTVEPYMRINQELRFETKGRISVVKWFDGWGEALLLESDYNAVKDSTVVTISTKFLDRGKIGLNVIYQNTITVKSYDLAKNIVAEGKKALAMLGKTMSGDVVAVNTSQYVIEKDVHVDLSKSGYFYKSSEDWRIYGRFPLIEINSPKGGRFSIRVASEIWGTDGNRIVPSTVFVQKLLEGKGGDPYSVVYDNSTGVITLELSPGRYHLRTEFEGVLDPETDPNQPLG